MMKKYFHFIPFKFSHPIMIQPTSFIKYYWRQMAQIIDLNKFLSDGDGWDFLIDSFWTLIWRKKKKKLSGYVKMTHVHTFQFRYY